MSMLVLIVFYLFGIFKYLMSFILSVHLMLILFRCNFYHLLQAFNSTPSIWVKNKTWNGRTYFLILLIHSFVSIPSTWGTELFLCLYSLFLLFFRKDRNCESLLKNLRTPNHSTFFECKSRRFLNLIFIY